MLIAPTGSNQTDDVYKLQGCNQCGGELLLLIEKELQSFNMMKTWPFPP